MAERRWIDQLDGAIEALLAHRGAPPPSDPKTEPLVELAAELRHQPREEFRARLKAEFARRAPMTTTIAVKDYIRPGFRTVTPYLLARGAARLMDFFRAAFQAEEILRVPAPDGSILHAEVRIGDSLVELADGGEPYPPMTAAIHLYVPDADAAYQRAIESGATPVYAPVDQEYGDREAGVKDPSGNTWYIATHRESPGRHAPVSLNDVTPAFHPSGADGFLKFLKEAFQAEESEVYRSPTGAIVHAKIRIGDSMLEVGEAHGQWGPMPCAIHLYVPHVDVTYQRAVEAGATSISAPADAPYGDRAAGVRDSWGNQWFVATYLGKAGRPG